MRRQRLIARNVETDVRIEAGDGTFDRFKRRPDIGATMRVPSPPDGARAGKVVVHLTPHRGGFADDRFPQVRRLRRRCIHDDRQRRL